MGTDCFGRPLAVLWTKKRVIKCNFMHYLWPILHTIVIYDSKVVLKVNASSGTTLDLNL